MAFPTPSAFGVVLKDLQVKDRTLFKQFIGLKFQTMLDVKNSNTIWENDELLRKLDIQILIIS